MLKVLKAVGLILAMLVIYYLAQTMAASVFGLVYGVRTILVSGASGAMPDVETITRELMGYMSAQTPLIILIAAAIALPTYYLFYMNRRQELLTFISVRGLGPVGIPVLIVFALSVNVLVELLLTLASGLDVFSGVFEQYEQLAGMFTSGGFVMSLIAVGVVGPIFEEILFRGLVFGELRKIMKVWPALLIQGVLFGLYHMNVVQSSYAMLLGILLGFVYYRSSSIIAPVIVHIVINSTSVLMSYLVTDVQYERWTGIIAVSGAALFILTSVFLLMGKSFRRCMDNSLYEQNRLPKPDRGPAAGM